MTLASTSDVSAFSTTAAATGTSALESCILKSDFMEEVPTTAASIFIFFICSFLPARAVQTFDGIHG